MAVVNLKPVAASRPARPTKAAIRALKEDPSLAPDFDAKYGAGAAATHLSSTVDLTEMMAELLEGQRELTELIAELVEVVRAPRQLFVDQDGDVVGSIPATNYRLGEDGKRFECTRCEKAMAACTCEDPDGDLLKA